MSPKEVEDLEHPNGLVRQISFGADEMAVVDVSSEALTVNWTTHYSAPQFIDATRHLPGGGYELADAVLCTSFGDLETDAEGLVRMAKDDDHSEIESWDLVRLDVSETRSIAWERLPGGVTLVGFGDDVECLHERARSDAAGQLNQLMELTRTPHIEPQSVVDNAVELANLWYDKAAEGQRASTKPALPEIGPSKESG